jgi:hypothetical protein
MRFILSILLWSTGGGNYTGASSPFLAFPPLLTTAAFFYAAAMAA